MRQVEALRKRWRECPPVDRLMAARVGYKPPLEMTDLPDGEFERRKAEQDDWFADPERFFAPGFGTIVKKDADG